MYNSLLRYRNFRSTVDSRQTSSEGAFSVNRTVGYVDSRAQPKQLEKLQTMAGDSTRHSQKIVQRLVAQSGWLHKNGGKRELSTSISGNRISLEGKKSTTRYRDKAEEILGSLDGLKALAAHGVLRQPQAPNKSPFLRAHLIAAEFGGELTYGNWPQSNIRYHPQNLEDSLAWKSAEEDVANKPAPGFVTTRSSEGLRSYDLSFRLFDLVKRKFEKQLRPELLVNLQRALGAADFVPSSVRFQYTDRHGINHIDRSFANDMGIDWLNLNSNVDKTALADALYKMRLLPDVLEDQRSPPAGIVDRAQLVSYLSEKLKSMQKAGPKKKLVDNINLLGKPGQYNVTSRLAKYLSIKIDEKVNFSELIEDKPLTYEEFGLKI